MTIVMPGISPARLRIEAAGRAYQQRKEAESAAVLQARIDEARRAWRQKVEERRRAAANRLEAVLSRGSAGISCIKLVEAVAQKHQLTIADLCGVNRAHHVVLARQEAMYLARKTGKSSMVIGRFFNRDHTTVLYSCRQYAERLERIERMKAHMAEGRA